jgi:hypothetical protein
MRVNEAFNIFQTQVDARPGHVSEARRRRDVFSKALVDHPAFSEAFASGSFARRTVIHPLHDVDLVAVLESGRDWTKEEPGLVLNYTAEAIRSLLGTLGQRSLVVQETKVRSHVVKCRVDSAARTASDLAPGAFAIEVMPAVRTGTGRPLLVPNARTGLWELTDPEDLIDRTAARARVWSCYVPTVRLVKYWFKRQPLEVKSLAAEVLALNCLPVPPAGGRQARSHALSRFFTCAAARVMDEIVDPAGYAGAVQPTLDREQARRRLRHAAENAANAVAAEEEGRPHEAICFWGRVFPGFPKPPGGCGAGWLAGGGTSTATPKGDNRQRPPVDPSASDSDDGSGPSRRRSGSDNPRGPEHPRSGEPGRSGRSPGPRNPGGHGSPGHPRNPGGPRGGDQGRQGSPGRDGDGGGSGGTRRVEDAPQG